VVNALLYGFCLRVLTPFDSAEREYITENPTDEMAEEIAGDEEITYWDTGKL
jgi:hypothetical protein